MGAHVSSTPHLSQCAHGRKDGRMDARTAGDVLREKLNNGMKKRELARSLAGQDASYTEIERWRGVLTRVQKGSEPKSEQAAIVAERFGVKIREPERERAKPGDRLRALEDEVAELREALRLSGEAHDALHERVAALEKTQRRARAKRAPATRQAAKT